MPDGSKHRPMPNYEQCNAVKQEAQLLLW